VTLAAPIVSRCKPYRLQGAYMDKPILLLFCFCIGFLSDYGLRFLRRRREERTALEAANAVEEASKAQL